MPAPAREQIEVELTGSIYRWWGGDQFEFGEQDVLHYIMVRGLDSPDEGEACCDQARWANKHLTLGKQLRVQVVGRDDAMREMADVSVPVGDTPGEFASDRFDLAAEMIARGYGRFDPTGFKESESRRADLLKSLELKARQEQRGMWAPAR